MIVDLRTELRKLLVGWKLSPINSPGWWQFSQKVAGSALDLCFLRTLFSLLPIVLIMQLDLTFTLEPTMWLILIQTGSQSLHMREFFILDGTQGP